VINEIKEYISEEVSKATIEEINEYEELARKIDKYLYNLKSNRDISFDEYNDLYNYFIDEAYSRKDIR